MFTDSYVGKLHKVTNYLIATHGLSYQEVAKKSRIKPSDLLDALRGSHTDYAGIYNAVIEALGYSVLEITSTIEFIRKYTDLSQFLMKIQEIDDLIVQKSEEVREELREEVQEERRPVEVYPESSVTVIQKRKNSPIRTRSERMIQQKIGLKLRDYRSVSKFSQTELAERMGIHQSSVSALERGAYPIRNSERFRQAFAAIGMDLDKMISEESRKLDGGDDLDESLVYSIADKEQEHKSNTVRLSLANSLRYTRMKNEHTIAELATLAKTTIEVIEDMERGTRNLPTSDVEAVIWRRVFGVYNLDFYEMALGSLPTEQHSA